MSLFQFQDGSAVNITVKVVNSTQTTIVDASDPKIGGQYNVARFEVNENNGGAPSLTVALMDPSGVFYCLGDSITHLIWKARPMTANQSVRFEEGYVVPNGWKIVVQSSDAAGHLDVIGIKLGKQRNPQNG